MKFFILFFASLAIISCGNNETAMEDHSDSTASKTSMPAPAEEKEVVAVKPAFANLDAPVSAHVKNIFDHYIHVKTALVNSDAAEAKKGAAAILEGIKDFDKSSLPAEQKKAYDNSIGGIRSAAIGIVGTDDIEKQRVQFETLSNQAYQLAKSFGAGKTLYHEHCPMAFDNKGALWLSETKEIKNPYYGEKMMNCGTVMEVIQN